jgi:nitrate reductase gamma subunit/ferredoxin
MMATRVNSELMPELRRYGAADIDACFNCGNCTAICPLSQEDESFPRRIIRYAQIGMEDQMLGSKELWSCYYCGECSRTCPRQAEPGEFMATARRYAIAHYDVTGLTQRLYKSAWFNGIFVFLLVAFFSLYLLSFSQGDAYARLSLWKFVPETVVRVLGLAVFALVAIVAGMGMVRMVRKIVNAGGLEYDPQVVHWTQLNWWRAVMDTIFAEALFQRSYREEECEEQDSTPWYRRKWFVHLTILYGFLGLFAATALDFLFKPVGSPVPLYYPMRLLGTVAGLSLLYGASLAFYRRLRRLDKTSSHSTASDWTFLAMLWLVGLTGFLLEIADYAPAPASWGYPVMVVHIALAMTLIVMLPFGKFAHVVYRTLAIFLRQLKPAEQRTGDKVPAAVHN